MQSRVLISSLLLTLLLQGCATNQPQKQKYYTKDEYTKLTYCVLLADIVRFASFQKLRKKTEAEVMANYKGKKSADISIPLVKKVYKDTFTNSWDYTAKFYDACGMKVADLTANRVRFAGYCHQNTLIASMATIFKKLGEPKEKMYEIYKNLQSKTPIEIIDRVYARESDKSNMHADNKLAEWNLCMGEISEMK
ncbi:MAG: hypothetical protein OEZ39_16470 [Gammaproteobacteria bacterium]|nr:hypothetical protein [Gammaproteobacteria bacterium]MDH5653455.1 hypothetical protein [Gammaproteobacteria bacterium]